MSNWHRRWGITKESYEEYFIREDHYNVGPAIGITSKADADLIAAAPELLSALRECVAWFEDNCVDCYALDDARKALEKARGES